MGLPAYPEDEEEEKNVTLEGGFRLISCKYFPPRYFREAAETYVLDTRTGNWKKRELDSLALECAPTHDPQLKVWTFTFKYLEFNNGSPGDTQFITVHVSERDDGAIIVKDSSNLMKEKVFTIGELTPNDEDGTLYAI